MPTFNSDIPEEFNDKAMPREAVVGHLADEHTVDEFLSSMTDAGLDGARIHMLSGEEGIAVLENLGTRLSRMFGPDRQKPIELLRRGATLVGIFGVADEDQANTSSALSDAGVTVLHRFGKWTYV